METSMTFRHLTLPEEKWKTLPLYEASFPEDRGDYANYYYQWKCLDNEILVLTTPGLASEKNRENSTEEICAMLHLNPYEMWISTQSVTLHYIVAVATALSHRRQGCMRTLMEQAFCWMYQQEEPFTYLMPADTVYYTPFGFRVIYDQTPVSFSSEIEKVNQQAKEQFDVVTLRNENYLRFLEAEPKPETTSEATVQEACKQSGDDQPEGKPGEDSAREKDSWKPQIMCRIIHAKHFLECLRAYSRQNINLFLKDPLITDNTGWYCWQVDQFTSRVQRLEEDSFPTGDCLTISIEDLAEQLFGIAPLHPSLSQIKVLKRICINEEV